MKRVAVGGKVGLLVAVGHGVAVPTGVMVAIAVSVAATVWVGSTVDVGLTCVGATATTACVGNGSRAVVVKTVASSVKVITARIKATMTSRVKANHHGNSAGLFGRRLEGVTVPDIFSTS
jgi:hypothetical protein